jgi:hypothetical protein
VTEQSSLSADARPVIAGLLTISEPVEPVRIERLIEGLSLQSEMSMIVPRERKNSRHRIFHPEGLKSVIYCEGASPLMDLYPRIGPWLSQRRSSER